MLGTAELQEKLPGISILRAAASFCTKIHFYFGRRSNETLLSSGCS